MYVTLGRGKDLEQIYVFTNIGSRDNACNLGEGKGPRANMFINMGKPEYKR